ncbi:hypothetical protein SUNI508_04724 [Seiridium unicorne]|uniref:Uncharacterized protein n=1 Tax=Seiridium unicorne TaxID=138068 RepID=A0ABR2V6X0_9PEZI
MKENDLDWIVEQQRYVLEEAGRVAREDLRCEVGLLRQQLLHAEIRETMLRKSVENHGSVEEDPRRKFVDTNLRDPSQHSNTDDWNIEQNRLYQLFPNDEIHLSTVGEQESILKAHRSQYQWMLEQQRRYNELQSKNCDISSAFGAVEVSSYAFDSRNGSPPPYEEHPPPTPSTAESIEHVPNQRRENCQQARPSQVRFTDPLEITFHPASPPAPKRKTKPKKQVIGLYRKRSNRTAV